MKYIRLYKNFRFEWELKEGEGVIVRSVFCNDDLIDASYMLTSDPLQSSIGIRLYENFVDLSREESVLITAKETEVLKLISSQI